MQGATLDRPSSVGHPSPIARLPVARFPEIIVYWATNDGRHLRCIWSCRSDRSNVAVVDDTDIHPSHTALCA